jgi:hypothetical protein
MQQQTEILGSPLNCEFKTPEQTEPGSFAFVRKNHVHEGIDLYCKENTIVLGGKILWHGVVVYGELTPTVKENDIVEDSSYPKAYSLFDWQLQQPKPLWLLDPTNKL